MTDRYFEVILLVVIKNSTHLAAGGMTSTDR